MTLSSLPLLRKRLRPLGLRSLPWLAALSCASCTSYPERTAAALDAFAAGELPLARELYADPELIDSPFLAGAESGMVALVEGRWEEARELFGEAAAAVESLEERALADPAALAEGLGSWLVNDTATAYEGEGFERVMLHACLGLSYLATGLVDDFGVEARLANRLLETEEELYEKEYQAGGLGHFLSATYYELRGEYDQAYIDYKRMDAKGVGTEVAGPALVRIARRLGRQDELGTWLERYGDQPQAARDAARVVVVAGVGLGPFKLEEKLTLPLPGGLFSMAAPVLVARQQTVQSLELIIDGSQRVRTATVEDVSTVGRENLEDRIALLALKSSARGVAKRELTRELQKEHGVAGRIAGDVFSFLSERADLRTWMTLPDTWQVSRVFLPPGEHDLALSAVGGEALELGRFELEPGETLFVLARNVRRHLFAHALGGRIVDSATP